MAWAQKLPSGNWRACYRGPDGAKLYAGTWPTKKRAMAAGQDAESDIRKGDWIDPRKSQTPFRDWVATWRTSWVLEVSTADTNRGRVDKHLLPTWGNDEIGDITHMRLQAWVAQLRRDGYAAWTVLGIVRLMSACMSAAVRADMVRSNPCDGLQLPAVPPPRDVVYEFREVDLIASRHVAPQDVALIRLLEWTGLRLGEAGGLHVPNVDMRRRIVRVRHTLVDRGATVREIKPYPKGASNRDVPIPDELYPVIGEHLDSLPPADVCTVAHRKGDTCPGGGLVFQHQHRRHLSRRRCDQVWVEARAEADEKDRADGGPGVREGTIHDLRHTYASRLVAAGMQLYDVKALLGHASIKTTERYAKHGPDLYGRAMTFLNGLGREANVRRNPPGSG